MGRFRSPSGITFIPLGVLFALTFFPAPLAARPTSRPAVQPAAAKPAPASAPSEPGERVGVVTHYYNHLGVAVVRLDSTTSAITDPSRWNPWRTEPASRTRLSGSPVQPSMAAHVRSSDDVFTTT